MSNSNTGAENIFIMFWFAATLICSPNTLCWIIWWLPHLTDVDLLLVYFPPVGDGEVPHAQEEGQGDHHQHEGQDGPEVSEILFIAKRILNNLRSRRAIGKMMMSNCLSHLFNTGVLFLSICILCCYQVYWLLSCVAAGLLLELTQQHQHKLKVASNNKYNATETTTEYFGRCQCNVKTLGSFPPMTYVYEILNLPNYN